MIKILLKIQMEMAIKDEVECQAGYSTMMKIKYQDE